MNSERWQHIDELFHAALKRTPEERTQFLLAACGGDEALRREVESLVTAHEQDRSFLNAPAYEIAAEMLVKNNSELTVGQEIGPYKILSTLEKKRISN